MATTYQLNPHDLSVNETGKVMEFSVVAGFIGKPTDKIPATGNGYRLVLDADGAQEAIKGLVGMGVNVCWKGNKEFCKHDRSYKIGVINDASIDGDRILCSGHLWSVDFPDVCDDIRSKKDFLGASVELAAMRMEKDDTSKIVTAKDFAFTGLSIVYKDKAAFMNTKFMCSVLEENDLTDKEIKDLLDAQKNETDEAIKAKFVELSASVVNTINDAVAKSFEGVKAELSAKEPEKKDPEKKEPEKKEPEAKEVELSASITDAIKAGFAGLKAELSAKEPEKKDPEKKSAPDFSSFERYGKDKSMMELSSEVDNDSSLSEEQKWKVKMSLWAESQKAGL